MADSVNQGKEVKQEIKRIKKRDFLKGFGMVSAGVVAAATDVDQAAAQVPVGVCKAKGVSMLDGQNYIGTASKGYGFRANWARTLRMVPSVDPNYKPRRISKAPIHQSQIPAEGT